MKFTTQFALQSRGTWLVERMLYMEDCRWQTGFSPSLILFSKRFTPAPPLAIRLEITIQSQKPQFPCWAHPCSFAITEEILFSFFPPLTYMLKFSGFANLTSCLNGGSQEWASVSTANQKMVSRLAELRPTRLNVSEMQAHFLKHKSPQPDAKLDLTSIAGKHIVDTEAGVL